MCALVVTADDHPGERAEFDELAVARACKAVCAQLAELRATDNFVGVVRDEGFIAVVHIDFGEGIGVREVLLDPLGIRNRFRPELRARQGAERQAGRAVTPSSASLSS